MNDINNMQKDIEDMFEMVDYFAHIDLTKVPVLLQIELLKTFFDFSNKLKPIYITALALEGDAKK